MIMAGGAGVRLWPLSRAGHPKQLLPIVPRGGANRSLLDLAVERAQSLVPIDRVLVCTGEAYRGSILATVPSLGDSQILGEPCGRDTLNAVALTAAVLEREHPDAAFAVLTADHVIEPMETFRAVMETGFSLVARDPRRLVTFGIRPSHAATGYGYVRRGAALHGFAGASTVAEFVEKPDAQTAHRYLESGDYSWNSGMFVLRAAPFLEAVRRFQPEAYSGIREVQRAWDTPHRGEVLARIYPTLPKISIDYAIMEPASRSAEFAVCTVEMSLSWLDVGSWPSLAETITPDESGNRIAGEGGVCALDSRGCLVVQEGSGHTIALLGCEGLAIVRTPGATLVMPLERAQDLKGLHGIIPPELQ